MPDSFYRIQRLPPYTFNVVNELKMKLRKAGEDIIDLGMGNPDLPTPPHIAEKLIEAAQALVASDPSLSKPEHAPLWSGLDLHREALGLLRAG